MPPKCPKGKILRSAYRTKKGTFVSAACTPDKGKPGKGVKVWTLTRGGLRPYRLVNQRTNELLSTETRRRLLRKAYTNAYAKGEFSKKGLFISRLNALRNYRANARDERGKKIHKAIGDDIAYASKNFN